MKFKIHNMCFSILIAYGFNANAEELSLNSTVDIQLYPHLATPSRTIGSGNFTYQPSVGYSMMPGSILLNNLSYGINHRFEFGFIPLLSLVQNSTMKITPLTFKWSILEGEVLDFGLSYTYINYRYQFIFENKSLQYNIDYNIPQLNFVWRINNENQTGISFAYKWAQVKFDPNKSQNVPTGANLFADYVHSPGNHLHYSIGVSSSEDLYTPKKDGMGLSITEDRKGRFFSSPRLGVHFFNNGENQLLLSSSFY